MTQYNIYYGTIGKTLGIKYRFTKNCRDEEHAKEIAKKACETLYYKNEGKYGLPNLKQISKEAKLTGLFLEDLYNSHIEDMCRYYVVPTEVDTISTKDLKY